MKVYRGQFLYELREIRGLLLDLGIDFCSFEELETIWCKFSDEKYCAQFMAPSADVLSQFHLYLLEERS